MVDRGSAFKSFRVTPVLRSLRGLATCRLNKNGDIPSNWLLQLVATSCSGANLLIKRKLELALCVIKP